MIRQNAKSSWMSLFFFAFYYLMVPIDDYFCVIHYFNGMLINPRELHNTFLIKMKCFIKFIRMYAVLLHFTHQEVFIKYTCTDFILFLFSRLCCRFLCPYKLPSKDIHKWGWKLVDESFKTQPLSFTLVLETLDLMY